MLCKTNNEAESASDGYKLAEETEASVLNKERARMS
jgi:hypothetical protein